MTILRVAYGIVAEATQQTWALIYGRVNTWGYRLNRRFPAHQDDDELPHHPGGIR